MDINALTGNYNDYYAQESAATAKVRDDLEQKDYANANDKELLEACKEFEAYFLEMVFKEMEKSAYAFSDKKDSPNSSMVDYFKENTIQALASDSTERQGLGLAQQLFEQMKRNYGI